jgi:hypothetical protein
MPPGRNDDSHSDHRSASTNTSSSKLQTDCATEHGNSLQCIQDNLHDKNVCQPFFKAYKECRAEENRRRLEANAKRFFWQ